MRDVLTFDVVIDLVRARPDLRLIGIDGLSLAGKSTLAGQLAEAAGGACIRLDDFVKPETEWRWHDRPSFPFDYIRYDEFMAAVRRVAENGWCQYPSLQLGNRKDRRCRPRGESRWSGDRGGGVRDASGPCSALRLAYLG